MTLRIGSLFSGVGGLDRAVAEVFDAEPAWFVEYEPAPARVLAHHYPQVPNLGDVTQVDWSQVPPVDILTGGTPCQDLSHADQLKAAGNGVVPQQAAAAIHQLISERTPA